MRNRINASQRLREVRESVARALNEIESSSAQPDLQSSEAIDWTAGGTDLLAETARVKQPKQAF